jgi:vitamin B12 transporter
MSPIHRPAAVIRRFALASVALAVASLSSHAQAQSGEGAREVVVTGTRTPQRIDQALAETTVIDRAQIEAAGGRTLAEVLSREAGVQIDSNGGLGKSASVRLRGLEARHTLLLIDGVRYGSATLGTAVWENIPLDAIERIEIVRGPLSGLYGSNAVGGVVQIFTRRGRSGFTPSASIKAGSNRFAEAAAGARFGSGAFDGALHVGHLRNRGFSATNERVPFDNFNADDDGFRQSSVSANGGVKFGDWRAEASLLASRGKTQYDDGLGVDTRSALRSEVLGITVGGPVLGPWRTRVRLSRAADEYETLATASPFSDLGTIATVQKQLTWENTIDTPAGTVLALVERVQDKVGKPGVPYDVSERTITGVALGLNGRAGAHHWQANVRRDRNSQFGGQTSGALAYGLDFNETVRAGFSLGRSFVSPSFNQLYFPEFGNPDLLPEEGLYSEFNLQWRLGAVQARLAYFDNRIRGYIAGGPRPTNIPRARIDGFSASIDTTHGAWTWAASADVLNPRNDTEGSAAFGNKLPRRAANSARVAADWRGGAWTLGGTLAAFGDRFDDTANTTVVSGYAALDLRADWQFATDWRLGLSLNNALGKRYETVFGYNQPGREAFASLRWAPR